MGSKRSWLIIWITFCALLWKNVKASQNITQNSLNNFVYDYAFNNMPRPRTGQLYNVPLPVNFSGMEVSVIRLRTHRLWRNGLSFNSFEIPPRVLPRPFTRRVDLMYQNLGNWSTFYYNVPNYTFVAPVIGFLAYDSNIGSTNNGLIEVNLSGDNPIIVRFRNLSIGDVRMRCVRFGANGTLEFTNLTLGSSCVARGEGHFSVVVPRENERIKRVFKWWILGIIFGFVGLLLVILSGIFVYKMFKWQKVRKMIRQSQESEALEIVWIGNSKMPSASGIRTQPFLENSYVP